MTIGKTAQECSSNRGGRNRRKIALCCLAIASLFLVPGCSTTSPILLQEAAAQAGEPQFPIKVGVLPVEKKGNPRMSDVGYWSFPFFFINAKMPRRTESDYVQQSVVDNLTDHSVFQYAYGHPFDQSKVDLLMQLSFDEYSCRSAMGGTYATLIGLPYVNLLQLVGVPQDWFFSDISVTCILTTPAGTEVARYSYKRKASDAVTIYEMPYGNYMWYESLFRDEFSKMMASFYADMEQDSDRIRTAVRR